MAHRSHKRGGSSESRASREPPPDPEEQARAVCLRLLTGSPRTRSQLAEALRKREIPDEVAEHVLERFQDAGLIDDRAFANAWVESRHRGRGLARRALAQELRHRGVDAQSVTEAVGLLDSEQEEQTATELVRRRLPGTRGLERTKRIRRLAGMLARRGYPESMALRVVCGALAAESAAAEDSAADAEDAAGPAHPDADAAGTGRAGADRVTAGGEEDPWPYGSWG